MFVILLKDKLRKFISYLGIDFTQNLKYDRQTKEIIKKSLPSDGIGIDIGCHKGEILDLFIKYAPKQHHYAFEPLPYLFEKLNNKYGNKHHIFPFALAETEGKTTFYHVKNAPAYSGIQMRKYDIPDPDVDAIQVDVRRLDELIPDHIKISLIKIDVEGGEMDVLKGAKKIIGISRPVILFEFGLGASDVYGTSPDEMYNFFSSQLYNIFLLDDYLVNNPELTFKAFDTAYNKKGEYYFVAVSQ